MQNDMSHGPMSQNVPFSSLDYSSLIQTNFIFNLGDVFQRFDRLFQSWQELHDMAETTDGVRTGDTDTLTSA